MSSTQSKNRLKLYEEMLPSSIRLGVILRQFRARHRLTQQEFSQMANIDYKHLQDLESDRAVHDPRLSTLRRIARALGMPTTEFIETMIPEPEVSNLNRLTFHEREEPKNTGLP